MVVNPTTLGNFEILRRLGAGGMAEVFLAQRKGAEGTFKQLVVKRILPSHGASRKFRSMFVEEAQVATRLNHPNVVQVFEFQDSGDEGLLLAMEFVEGPDLGLAMARAKALSRRISPWASAWMIAEAAKGLHYAHEKRDEGGTPLEIVHRDVSPQNILVSYEGNVKIADFGIASAKLFAEDENVLKGKFGYMSPEQARGETVDRRSDIYSLGVVLWEALTGKPIHGGLGGEALLDIVRSGHVDPPSFYANDIPSELEAVVMKALEPRADARYSTAREFAAAIILAFPKKELVEASLLVEETIVELVPRENEPPRPPKEIEEDEELVVPMPTFPSEIPSRPGRQLLGRASRPLFQGPREVRHVALVSMRLHGIEELKVRDPSLAERTLDRLRSMLGEIAYKRGVRAWIWADDERAIAVAGLTSNPTRATSEAAWLALDTHEVLSGLSEDLPFPIKASIGIVRGIASGTRDASGNLIRYRLHDPANYLAEVVREATAITRTWVAGGVFRLVRREFLWGDVPGIQLDITKRGELPSALRVYSLERGLSPKELQGMQRESDLVGRDAEKADLLAAYHRAVLEAGSGSVTARALIGELGIGKSALVSAFVADLPLARTLRIECSPVKQEVPLSTIADLIRTSIGVGGEEPFETVVQLIANIGGGNAGVNTGEPVHPMVLRLAELATNRPLGGEDEDPVSRRKQLLAGLRALLAALAMSQPLVVVVEGLQWTDRPSLDVLSEVIKAKDPLPILVVLVSRPDDRVASLLEGVVRIELRGLSPEEQLRLVEARLGVHEGVKDVCAELLPKVGGNPFFLLEMVDALLERGTLEIKELEENGEKKQALTRREGALAHLPSTLEQLLGDRLHELPTEEHRVVDWLAINGGPLGMNDMDRLIGPNAGDAIVRLCARGVCDKKGETVDFRHPLTRDVAYAALHQTDRVQMHRALGQYLGTTSLGRGQSAAIVARHLVRGEADRLAAPFFLEAANAARNSNQVALATRSYIRAIACLPPGDARIFDAHDALEGIYRVLGRRRERVRHLDGLRKSARASGSAKAAVTALVRTARFDLDEGRLQEGVLIAQKAAEAARLAHTPSLEVEAEALTSEFLRELGNVQEALEACDRALRVCDPEINPSIAPRVRAEVLRARGVLLRRVGRVREAIQSHVEAIAVFRKAEARRSEARAKNALAFAMFCEGRYEDTISLALESIQIDLAIGGRFQIAKTLTNIGHAYAKLGDSERALAYVERSRQIHDRYGDQDGRAETLIVTAEILLDGGRYDEADKLVKEAEHLIAATNNAYDFVHATIIRSAILHGQGDAQGAVKVAEEARRAAERQALVSFHVYAQALEASARFDLRDSHAATLLATTALGVEHMQGCEYGLEVRSLAARVLTRSGSPQAEKAQAFARDYAKSLLGAIRNPRMKALFQKRPIVSNLLGQGALILQKEGSSPGAP